jgi:hypothetical protein
MNSVMEAHHGISDGAIKSSASAASGRVVPESGGNTLEYKDYRPAELLLHRDLLLRLRIPSIPLLMVQAHRAIPRGKCKPFLRAPFAIAPRY